MLGMCSTWGRKRDSQRAVTAQVGEVSMMQPRDNKRARLLPSATLDTLDDDLLIKCASYLDADGLAQLGRTSARFGIPQAGQQRSLANEAARQRFRQSATDEERKCLPKYGDESDIGLCRALELSRQPLRFDELVGNGFSSQEHPASVTYTGRGGWSTAMSGHVMRGGRHFVEFTLTLNEDDVYINLGVIRPVSLTNGIDLLADWEGIVYPATVSSSQQPALAENLRSHPRGLQGGMTAKSTAVVTTVVMEIAVGPTGTMPCVLPQGGKDVKYWKKVAQLGCC